MTKRVHIPPRPTPQKDESKLDLAMGFHREAKLMLQQSRDMHDLTMGNQRRLVMALSNLVPANILEEYGFNAMAKDVSEIADNSVALNAGIKNRDIFDIVHSINVLAMANADVIHIFTHFMGHVNTLEVSANRAGTNYLEENRKEPHLIREHFKLSHEDALEKLLSIESQLTELIITAREKAEAKAEVEA